MITLPRLTRSCAASSRIRPRMAQARSHSAAAKKTISPSSTSSCSLRAAFSSSEKNLIIGDFHSPSSDLMKARPFAPRILADSSSAFISPCVISASPLALKALTTPPFPTVPEKTLKSEFLKVSEKSCIFSSKRVSGLSTPYWFMAS